MDSVRIAEKPALLRWNFEG